MTQKTKGRHFIDLRDISAQQARLIIDKACAVKKGFLAGEKYSPLSGKVMALIFEKPSTRTRISFDVGMMDLGIHTITISSRDMQLGRGESVADTARILSRYVDAVMIRTDAHDKLTDLAQYGHIPVINGLTDFNHPCQIMADILTFEEHRGAIGGKTIAWVGDGNNVANSWIHAAVLFGFSLRLACPQGLEPSVDSMAWAQEKGGDVQLMHDPESVVAGADAVVTDTWVSMGDAEEEKRKELLSPYQVNEKLMAQAASDALFMHCLPAHRGEEVTAEVIDGAQSVVWDEAENRLHAQKGIALWCFEVI